MMTADHDLADADAVARMVGALRTPSDLRQRRPVGTVVRGARAFAAQLAVPTAARAGEPTPAVAELPDGVLASGRSAGSAAPTLPQGGGALAAYAALLARKRRAPRDMPVRGLPLTVHRPAHAQRQRLPGTVAKHMVPVDADLSPNAARQAAKPRPTPSPQATAPARREAKRTSTTKAARAAREAREARQQVARTGKAAKAASDVLRAANVARAQKAGRAARAGRTTNRRGTPRDAG